MDKDKEDIEVYEQIIEELKSSTKSKEGDLHQLATFCKNLQAELLSLRPLSRNIKKLEQDNTELIQSLTIVEKDFEDFRKDVEWRERQLMHDKDKAEMEAVDRKLECDSVLQKNGHLIAKLSHAYSELDKMTGVKISTTYNSTKIRSLQ